MKIPTFQTSGLLGGVGVEHGFGTLLSGDARVSGLVTARQVHGTTLSRVPCPIARPEADALWSDEPGVAVGSAARIGEEVVTEIARASRVDPSEMVVAIRPHIGPCCYEVDDPVRRLIPHDSVFSSARRAGHYMLDLCELNRIQLVRAGVREDRIDRVGGCTACEGSLYHSYRRGREGRMVHWVRVPQPWQLPTLP